MDSYSNGRKKKGDGDHDTFVAHVGGATQDTAKAKKPAPLVSRRQGKATGEAYAAAAAQRDSVAKPLGVIGTLKALRGRKKS